MRLLSLLLVCGCPFRPSAQEQDTTSAPVLTFGAFADLYYAYDFGKPANFDRFYTTQPARHNEFNVNLAFVEARLAHDRFRGRVALQAGTSVQSNYLAEPSNGVISGGDLSRHIQEAVVGVRARRGALGRRRGLLLPHRPGGLDFAGQPHLHPVPHRGLHARTIPQV